MDTRINCSGCAVDYSAPDDPWEEPEDNYEDFHEIWE